MVIGEKIVLAAKVRFFSGGKKEKKLSVEGFSREEESGNLVESCEEKNEEIATSA